MSIAKEIAEDTEIAKNRLMQSNLDDKCKKQILRVLNVSAEATNGISLDEKVQKVTETIHGMVVSQITFLDSVDKKIEAANREQCKTCKAMKLADDVEEQKKREEIIDAWKRENGYSAKEQHDPSELTIFGTMKTILVKPYAWIFGSIAVFSPYSLDILNKLLDFFSK